MIKDYRKNMSAEVTDAFKGLCLAVQTAPAVVQSEYLDSNYTVRVRPTERDRGIFVSLFHPMRTLATILGGGRGFSSVTYLIDVPINSPGRRPRIEIPDREDWGKDEFMRLMTQSLDALFEKTYHIQVKATTHKTTVVVSINSEEFRYVTDLELEMALSRVFGAAARARGRKLYVELRREG